jgi:isomerase DpgB
LNYISIAPLPQVVTVDIDESAGLTGALIQRLELACDAVEDGAANGILEMRLRSGSQCTPTWPGNVSLDTVHKWEKALRRLERLPGITLVVAEGRCGAGAIDLLAVADYRIAGSGLRLYPRGVGAASWPGVAMYRVAARAGQSAARAVFMFGAEITATRAAGSGLADEVADDTQLARDAFVESLVGVDSKILASRRMIVLEGLGQSYERVVGLHLAACAAELRSRPAVEAAAAQTAHALESVT